LFDFQKNKVVQILTFVYAIDIFVKRNL